MSSLFMWHCFDVRPLLPQDWQERLLEVAATHATDHYLTPNSSTSREGRDVSVVPVSTVDGVALGARAEWLDRLYRDAFRQLAERAFGQAVRCAENPRRGINLNVQHGTEQRYEVHVDSNPVAGLLYVTDQPKGSGGELVVSNVGDVTGARAVEQDASMIYPVAGHLVLFDARGHSHFVRPLASEQDRRVVVAMNFYTDEAGESTRPTDLDRHLFGVE